MALIAHRAHPLAKARFKRLPPRTARHPRAAIVAGVLGVGGLATAIHLGRIWRRGSALNRPEPRQIPLAGRQAIVEAAAVGLHGYKEAPSTERIALHLLGSFGATIALARVVTYVQTQRQPILSVKKLRQLRHSNPRVHHYVPGIALAFTSGGLGILIEEDKAAPWLALPFGVGMGLTLDETALLLGLPASYWTQEYLSAIQAVVALAGTAALAFRISRRGERAVLTHGQHSGSDIQDSGSSAAAS